MNIPEGYRLTILNTDYRGFVSLDSGAEAEIDSSFQIGGHTSQVFSHVFAGATTDDVAVRDTVAIATAAWSPCGGKAQLRLDITAALTGQAGAAGLLTLDSTDAELVQKYGLAWQICNP